MAKEDIHNTRELLNRKAEGYISQLFTEDQEDTRLFINDLLAQGFSKPYITLRFTHKLLGGLLRMYQWGHYDLG